MMYITKITLDNVRCYEYAELDFGDDGNSLVLCGDNGSGKTSVLRSIALGLCDHISAGALLRDLPGDFIRKTGQRNREAVITIELISNALKRERFTLITRIKTRRDVGFEWVETTIKRNGKKLKQEHEFPWQQIFVTAYGAGLRTNGSEDYAQYLAPDAVYSLFDYSYPLHNPELAWRRLVEVSRRPRQMRKTLSSALNDILALGGGTSTGISLEENGLFVESSWGKQELDALGDGYRALVTLTLDILAWQLLAKNHELILASYESGGRRRARKRRWREISNFKTLKGIVIIDELEKHLHPRLQLRVLKTLRSHFPKMQFVVTTHSPLVASSVNDIPTVFLENGRIGARKHMEGWLAENVYQQMGIGGSRPVEYRTILSEYERLFIKKSKGPLSRTERGALNRLRAKLKELPGTDLALLDIETDALIGGRW
jgi:hypothetical protein